MIIPVKLLKCAATAALLPLMTSAVPGAPTILSAPAGSLNLLAGSSPIFLVKAAGTAPINYQWKRGGAEITGNPTATTSALTIPNATAAVSGSYSVTVTDATGPVTSVPFTLTFSAPPAGDQYAARVLADGPSAYWRMDETAGTALLDAAGGMNGTGNSARIERGIPAAQGMAPNQATRFKATTDGLSASVPYSPNLNPAGAFSVECWVKPDLSKNTGKAVLSTQNRSAGRAGYVIYQGNSGDFWDAHLGSGGSFVAVTGQTRVVAGRWDHLVLTYDGIDTARLYVNGFLEKAAVFVLPFRNNEAAPLELGSRSGGTLAFAGAVDEVALYHYELSAEQIENHFSITYLPAAITAPPVAMTSTVEGSTTTLTVGVTGFPNTYEWLRDGFLLDAGELNSDGSRKFPGGVTGTTLVMTQALPSDAGTYILRITNPLFSLDATDAVVEVALDTSPPAVVSILSKALNVVQIKFDRPMTPEAVLFPESYTFTGGVTALRVTPTSDASVFEITTTGMTNGGSYSLRVDSSVTDARIGMNPIGANLTTFTVNALALVDVFTGGDGSEGLDLDGDFRYAFNFGTPGAAGLIRSADFSADTAPGISWSAPNEIANWHRPEYGDTPEDDAIERVMESIRWNTGPVTVNLSGLTVGNRYKLQLLFAEQCCAGRGFDIKAEGSVILNDFLPAQVQGGAGNTSQGVVVTYEFQAGDASLNLELVSTDTADPAITDHNPILSGGTLETLASPPPDPKALTGITRGPASLTIHATGTSGKTYAIDYSTDLQIWSEVQNALVPGADGTGSWTDTSAIRAGPGVVRGYYRMRDPLRKPAP